MPGKRITDLTLAPLLYPVDYIPVARDNQTMRVPGSAVVASHVYEPHRKVNEYSSQKYLIIEQSPLVVDGYMNNTNIVVATKNLSIALDPTTPFLLGFEINLYSILDETVSIRTPESNGYVYQDAYNQTAGSVAKFLGQASTINPYEGTKIVHAAPGVWLMIQLGGRSTSVERLVEIVAPAVTNPNEVPALPTAPVIVIDTTGNRIALVAIQDPTTTFVSIGNVNTTLESINGASAYSV